MVDNNKIERIKESISKLFNNNNSNNYIFIYTPPKVGSTTLVSSLRISLGKTYNIIHIHDEVMLSVLTGINNITVNEMINYLATSGNNVYVIDVYRTPIERKMSEFFEKISPYHFNNTEENINNYSIERVSNRFNKIFTHIEKEDHYFDKYNIPNPIPFDYNNKYTIQEINKIKYVKLRLCDATIWSILLSNILNTHIVLVTDYQTENKKIGELYKKFKNEYKLPSNFFEIIKECKYLKFYYSKEEKERYLNFWACRLCDPVIPYTDDEYKFYVNLYLENQHINDIQIEHYIDNGCFCKYCSIRRRDIFFKSKNGEAQFEKIIHEDVVIEEKINKIININQILKKKMQNKKYSANQFSIKLK